jgi:hypothetical protein
MARIAQIAQATQPPSVALVLTDDFDPAAWRDRAVIKLARQYALPITIARVIADHAGLGNREAA